MTINDHGVPPDASGPSSPWPRGRGEAWKFIDLTGGSTHPPVADQNVDPSGEDVPYEYAKAERDVRLRARLNKRQRRLLARLGRLRARVIPTYDQLLEAHERLCRERSAAAAARSDAEEPDIFGDRRGRELVKWVKWPVSLLCGGLLFMLDSTMLLPLLLPLFTTRLLSVALVAAAEGTAMWYGIAKRKQSDAIVEAEQVQGLDRLGLRVALPLGVGIELTLAGLRSILTGQVLTSALLGMAGVALWSVVAWVTYRSANLTEDKADRADRKSQRAARYLRHDRKTLETLIAGHAQAHQELTSEAAAVIGDVDLRIRGVQALYSRKYKTAAPPFPDLQDVAIQRALASGELPDKLRLPDLPQPPPCAGSDGPGGPGWDPPAGDRAGRPDGTPPGAGTIVALPRRTP